MKNVIDKSVINDDKKSEKTVKIDHEKNHQVTKTRITSITTHRMVVWRMGKLIYI